MPTRVGGVVVPITGDVSGLLRATRTGSTALSNFSAKASRQLKRVGDSFTRVGRTMSTAITAPVAIAGVAVAKMGGDFEKSMNKVLALSGSTSTEFKQLGDQAKYLGRTTVFSASQTADAMGFLAMAKVKCCPM